ncbi:MAG: hypothetical protein K6G51_06310, partial [Sphaerochaetaceae bacterium]|nr:hypothetical protein [Sphaerochaetaceae bacterium]
MKIKDYFDLKTKRICVAASVTVILTSIILTLLYMTGDFWIKIWSLVLAVIQPIIIGGIFCYLLAPLVERIESILIGSKKAERPNHLIRSISVLLSFLLVIVGILILLSLIIVTVTKSIESINIEALKNLALSTQNDMNEL